MLSKSLRLKGSFSFGAQQLLKDLDLQLDSNQWTCLLGPSGIGKSTILRLLAQLPTGGLFNGSMTWVDGQSAMPAVAYMAQADLLAPWLNVRDNVLLGARLRGQQADLKRADALIDRVGLTSAADKRPAQLSGGMRQRAALARTLMEDCPLVLLDEPFSALDARTRADMQELAFELLGGATVLLATHDPGEAARLAHRIVILSAEGLHDWPVPDLQPIRAPDDERTLRAQAQLLRELRSPAGKDGSLSIKSQTSA